MKLNISFKFFLMLFLFAAITLGVFSLFFSIYFSKILVNREFASFQALTSSFLAQTENEIRNMDDVSISLFYSNLAKDSFARYLQSTDENLDDDSFLLELFTSLNVTTNSLPVIAMYSNERERVAIGTFSTREKINLNDLSWVEATKKLNCHKNLSTPYRSSMMQKSKRVSPYYISLYRLLKDDSGNDMGYIETAQYCNTIFEGIMDYRKQMDKNLNVFVYNCKGVLLFPFEEGSVSEDLSSYYFDTAKGSDEAQVFRNPHSGKEELLFGQKSAYTRWTYICAQDLDAVLLSVRDVSRILLLATVAVLLIITAVSLYMSNSISRPVRTLLKKIHQTHIGNLTGEILTIHSSYNEFDELNDAFHAMSSNLKDSMAALLQSRQREAESRYLALQSQITPHFYNNSLSSIIALTETHKEEEVIQFCKNLSRIMGYSASSSPSIVPLADEIAYVEKYLYCMKVRYQSSLNYSISIAPELEEVHVPKLIIQPLIENAIKYGTDCDPPWMITITGGYMTDGWAIRISDSGQGFSPEAMEEVQRMLALCRNGSEIDENDFSSIGLANVFSRWRMFAEGEALMDVKNTDSGCSILLGQIHKKNSRDKTREQENGYKIHGCHCGR